MRFRVIGALAGALAVALLATACGGDDNYGAAPANTTGAAATVAATTGTSATAGATSSGAAAAAVKIADVGTLGKIVTDASGRTLYVFDTDTAGSGKSACSGGCASTWPPAVAPATITKPDGLTGDLTAITRDDGTRQLALGGRPLYLYAGDAAAGDAKGDGIGGIWHVVKATGVTTEAAPSAAPAGTAKSDPYGY
ncbi:MAG: hypothetical protein HYX53_15715 [Chloroflexi bacterium]|nr:hypothetical protein [Chloroflexota bacterium]